MAENKVMKQTIVFDFDGVIHSYLLKKFKTLNLGIKRRVNNCAEIHRLA
ncbi:MAG: hypothetical protein J6A49_02710 [Clostridia bacterium]|nr:hypothetical protein [Clostridia bacterium]